MSNQSVVKATFERPQRSYIDITLVGESPLIVHNFALKSQLEMLSKQANKEGKRKRQRPVRDPFNEYLNSMRILNKSGTQFGFPCMAMKKAMIFAAGLNGCEIPKTKLRGAFFIFGPEHPEDMSLYGVPRMRMDGVKIGGQTKVADLRFRACFDEWVMKLRIRRTEFISVPDLLGLAFSAGEQSGLGEMRPEKGYTNGMFTLEMDDVALKNKARDIIRQSEAQEPCNTKQMREYWMNALNINFDWGYEGDSVELKPELAKA